MVKAMKRVWIGMLAVWAVAGAAQGKGLFEKDDEQDFAGKVVVMRVGEKDLMSNQSFRFMRRILDKVENEHAAALVIEIDTPGGAVWETTDLMMNHLVRLDVPTYAFVNSRAISGGALVAISADTIYMAPAASIGAAGVVSFAGELGKMERAKAEGMVVASATSVAALKGHDPKLIEAMIVLKKTYEKGPVKVGDDELVTLSTQQATAIVDGKPILAKGVAKSVVDLLAQENITADVVVPEPTGFEQFAWIISKLSPILILIGLAAGYLEIKTPGFGIGGSIALIAFGLFFFGNHVAGNLAGYELLGVFVLGIALIAAEIFIFPGTFIPGLIGALLAGGSLLFAMVDRFGASQLGESENFFGDLLDLLVRPSVYLSIGVLGSVVVMMIMMRFLPDIPIFRSLVLQKALPSGAGLGDAVGAKGGGRKSLLGQTGVALTDLRPGGKAKIGGRKVSVTADGFVEAGARVRVVEETPFRILVAEIENGAKMGS
jgi:membrane-bound serine protease (ClpP class)